jgi:hypothetical protein
MDGLLANRRSSWHFRDMRCLRIQVSLRGKSGRSADAAEEPSLTRSGRSTPCRGGQFPGELGRIHVRPIVANGRMGLPSGVM